LSNDPRLSTSDVLSIHHLQQSAQNVAGGMLDSSDVEPSDLAIIASPMGSDKDVDTTVEQTCEKINLTATNVRSIIRVSIYTVIFALIWGLQFRLVNYHVLSLPLKWPYFWLMDFAVYKIISLWAAGGIRYSTCLSICACILACPRRRHFMTGLPMTSTL